MKKSQTERETVAKDSDIRKAIGGQPESDQDAREAGLTSATSAQRNKSSRAQRASQASRPGSRKK